MLLSMLLPGESANIIEVRGNGDIRQRLLDMGFLPGNKVSMVRYAPLGDPIEVEILGTRIFLRQSEARLIRVAPIGKRLRRRRGWRWF